jgi:hypothetical protein
VPERYEDAVMLPILLALWEANYSVYGAHKLWKAAMRSGHDIGRDHNTERLHGYLNDVLPTEFEAAWSENLALSCSQSPANDVGDMKGPGELTLAVALGNQ